ncbi:hypothetical protein Dimus_013428 [Dionaea muscipula]
MSSPSREWSWEPRLPYVVDPSLLEMTPLRIPSPAPDSPENICHGSEESSSSGDESCPPCKLGEGNALHVSDGGVTPCVLEEGVPSRGLGGIPPPYSLVTRREIPPPGKLRIKLKPKFLGEPSQSRPETTMLCVVDAKKILKKALSEAENFLVQVLDQHLEEGRVWDVNMKPYLSSLQLAGIILGSPDLRCPELKLSSSSFLSVGGGGFARPHVPGDDDVGSYVGSEEAELRTPPLQDLTGVQSMDETGMTKGRRLQPSSTSVRGGRGRRGTGGRGRHDSPDQERVNSRDYVDHEQRDPRDAEDRHPNPPPTELTRGKEVASDYPREEGQKRR